MKYGKLQKNNEPKKKIKNFDKKQRDKVEVMDKDEEEYECLNNGNNKINHHLLFSSISFKSHEADLNFNKNIINNHNDNNINKEYIKKLSKKKDVTNSDNNIDINDNQKIYDYTNKIYNSDEHLNNNNNLLKKRKNSCQHNLFDLNNLIQPEKIKKTVLSKIEHRKSLFYVGEIKEEEEKLTMNRKLRESLISKEKSCGKNKKKNKINNFAAFFKLKEKVKKPQKIYYIDTILKNNTITSNLNNSFQRNTNKDQTVKTLKTNKTFKTFKTFKTENKRMALSPDKGINKKIKIKKLDNEAEIYKKLDDVKMEYNKNQIQIEQRNKTEKKLKIVKKINCIPFHFSCCLINNFN